MNKIYPIFFQYSSTLPTGLQKQMPFVTPIFKCNEKKPTNLISPLFQGKIHCAVLKCLHFHCVCIFLCPKAFLFKSLIFPSIISETLGVNNNFPLLSQIYCCVFYSSLLNFSGN